MTVTYSAGPHPLLAGDPILRTTDLFQGADLDLATEFEDEFDTMDAERGTVLFAEGDAGDRLYTVLSGKVKLSRRSHDGRQGLIALLGPSDQFGELELIDGGPRVVTATVVSDARLAYLSKTVLDHWITQRPHLAEQLLRVIARRIRGHRASVDDRLFSDVPGRVAGRLIQLADQFGVVEGGSTRVVHDLTQTELAQFVGASRESVNKVLAEYSNRGWLRLEHKCVVILDGAPLARRAQRRRRR
ncbi:Crp/Fnr family transcriptional regulator [Dactylosporangium roseum]|uniref:Crp/Fnr family transcriptional regulator n=1 Tax=Dactylosporangium roseum TaxID=47989 RepID=A0ABY5YUT6_9ACTN|nr:Crp/Fnr family transcriptional regulator [Dactylosporangium roseum]UWZ33489.1 Crp/Fnr family transcriptional regulator [Dactylosporangium roseum]